ncbi:MAG: ATP-binding protein [Desulfopila sp.]|jgi:two-component system C4-dicarboxylate transport sensor histidine kinase DctB|nr:ATP-binding protein [Desulfopila sp.]
MFKNPECMRVKQNEIVEIQSQKKIRLSRIFFSSYSIYLFTICILVSCILYYIAQITYNKGMESLAHEGSVRLELHETYLRGILEKYENLPELLASDKRLVSYLLEPDGQESVEALNKYLETIKSVSNGSDVYLMNTEGLTIAASNWNEPLTFVGSNFHYRPYFQEAIAGRLGRYFALGTTSSRRGYYFAYPVKHQNEIIGVLALKIGIDAVEQSWSQKKQSFLVTDPDGVIFFTTNFHWRFRTLYPLAKETKERIVKSKRYLDTPLEPIPLLDERLTRFGRMVKIRQENTSLSSTYLLQSVYMDDAGWNVQILSDIREVEKLVALVVILSGSFFILGALVHLIVRQRKLRLTEVKKFEEQSRRMLEHSNERLESRVIERTAELTFANEQLVKEIEERKRAEEALKKTRFELVHAAKLAALGQMSAGINHELNQPLAAIRSYTDNCKLFLNKKRNKEVEWNLDQISELTDRMARIGAQLKLFARKSSGQLSVVPVHGIVDGALEILQPALRTANAHVKVGIDPESLEVKANNVLLQQVMVNLVGNALQAIEDSEPRAIDVTAERCGGKVKISVQDSGKGIDPKHLPYIFEPFYTTKKSGQGLGLGLTITERILHEMKGEIKVCNIEKGARFEVYLEEAL